MNKLHFTRQHFHIPEKSPRSVFFFDKNITKTEVHHHYIDQKDKPDKDKGLGETDPKDKAENSNNHDEIKKLEDRIKAGEIRNDEWANILSALVELISNSIVNRPDKKGPGELTEDDRNERREYLQNAPVSRTRDNINKTSLQYNENVKTSLDSAEAAEADYKVAIEDSKNAEKQYLAKKSTVDKSNSKIKSEVKGIDEEIKKHTQDLNNSKNPNDTALIQSRIDKLQANKNKKLSEITNNNNELKELKNKLNAAYANESSTYDKFSDSLGELLNAMQNASSTIIPDKSDTSALTPRITSLFG